VSPQVVAAIIAASVSVLTLIGTLAAQYFGRHATSRDTEKSLEQQGRQLDRTLTEQREQLDRTLAEQRKQLDRTLAEQRTRTLNERFATAASQLGDDKPPAVRLAGVYAMAGLADDWAANRQTCVDVLCAYLRMPYRAGPHDQADQGGQLAYRAIREVRHTVIRVITAHLKDGAAASWRGLNLDFTGVVFDGGEFSDAVFAGGEVSFRRAKFTGSQTNFRGAKFTGGQVKFDDAEFTGGWIAFRDAEFIDGRVSFRGAEFGGGQVSFDGAAFTGGTVNFRSAEFTGGEVSFIAAEFSGSRVYFAGAEFTGAEVSFYGAKFRDGRVDFAAEFRGGRLNFERAEFTGGRVSFGAARFNGGEVDFSDVTNWSHAPEFDWQGTPPPMVKLPARAEIRPRTNITGADGSRLPGPDQRWGNG
jgi:uncharacterized protein YjbI with pentapeptide repeats